MSTRFEVFIICNVLLQEKLYLYLIYLYIYNYLTGPIKQLPKDILSDVYLPAFRSLGIRGLKDVSTT